jgi:hypothetical protein
MSNDNVAASDVSEVAPRMIPPIAGDGDASW